MPYCPKCDMEFIDGITVCSDCGGPLVESEEVKNSQKMSYSPMEDMENQEDLDTDILKDGLEPEDSYIPTGIYVRKAEKYAEMKSSASAFLLVGSAILVFSLLCWLGLINLPMSGFSKMLFQTVLTAMGAVFLLVSIFTYKSAGTLFSQIEVENQKTDELIHWFSSNYTGEALDEQLTKESSGLSPEELSLKRFELIQDILITHHDLTDQAYADSISEDIYSKLYESFAKGL